MRFNFFVCCRRRLFFFSAETVSFAGKREGRIAPLRPPGSSPSSLFPRRPDWRSPGSGPARK